MRTRPITTSCEFAGVRGDHRVGLVRGSRAGRLRRGRRRRRESGGGRDHQRADDQPATDLRLAGEWIELYNRGDEAADLEGWTIGDEIYDDIVLPAIVVEPGEFVLLARNGDVYRNGGVAADYVYGNAIILWNSDDLVVLARLRRDAA